MDAKLEAFRDLCRKASIETDPAELCCGKETLKTELKPSVMTDVRQRT